MKKAEARIAIGNALKSLKPFQEATLGAATERLLRSGQRHLLIADETGLGKTIVAKGLIANMLKVHLDSGIRKTFKVTYICSNQAIAGENIEKLNFLPPELVTLRKGNRIAYMAKADEENIGANSVLEISTLTPATSFQTSQSQGSQWERVLIFNALLDGDSDFRRYGKSVATLLRGPVWRDSWEDDLRDWYKDKSHWCRLRQDFGEKFVSFLRVTKSVEFLSDWEKKYLLENGKGQSLLLDLVWSFVKHVKPARRDETHWSCNQLIKVLRRAMTQVCLGTVSADLYILDEFQRFDRLIRIHESTAEDGEPEETSIAREVFSQSDCKILMLSATPFKAYSGQDDQDGSDAHYRELMSVLRFLLNGDSEKIKEFEKHRRALYRQLSNLKPGEVDQLDPAHKEAVEAILRPIICRTERVQNSQDFNAMVRDRWKENPLQIGRGDIQSYISTDQTIQTLSEVAGRNELRGFQPIEYCKSAPYTLSFLNGYKVHKVLVDPKYRKDKSVRNKVKQQKAAWLDMRQIRTYKWSPRTEPDSHRSSRLLHLLDEALPTGTEQLLWVPPSLPYYPLSGPFLGKIGFSKTLVFSSWLMVPRMISTLLSYEVEHLTIGDPRSVENEKEERRYFAAEDNRHPRPLMTFEVKGAEKEFDGLLSRMTNFCLLYPSVSLAKITNPLCDGRQFKSLVEYRSELADKIGRELDEIDYRQYEGSGTSSERWYWMAPLLLDQAKHKKNTESWLKDIPTRSENGYFRSGVEEDSGRFQYFNQLVENSDSPFKAGLGSIPGDLNTVLADMAIASPANVAYRLIHQVDPSIDDTTLRSWAMTIADGFTTLFNKPESIAAIRVASHGKLKASNYWRQALHYCVEGCLQSVLDEYAHLLNERFSDVRKLVLYLRDSISITTNSLRVDDVNWFFGEEKDGPRMRTHAAVQLGNQRLETPEGEKRIASLRQNFNSPFRPFLMATTSIGQEGLDFHAYCRRIVHWNLPSNPIDLEQREGRINRYKGLVIRQEIAGRYGSQLPSKSSDIWKDLFRLAGEHEEEAILGSGLVPYWAVRSEHFHIERVVPLYPFSKDGARLKKILRTLAIYRLAFGQPRQSELIEYLKDHFNKAEIDAIRSKLMIDLSPYNYRANQG